MERRVIETADGSKTLFIPEMNEQYHSVNGAKTESEYVFLEKGYRAHSSISPTVFEVGFGTGLNALLTLLDSEKEKRKTRYISIEKYPVNEKEVLALDYGSAISKDYEKFFVDLHQSPWNTEFDISEYFSLFKIKKDLSNFIFPDDLKIDVVFFDAFGPDKQPEMWKNDIFLKIFHACNRDAIFVTYSAKGEIRRMLAACGFSMERLPGPPGKRQMLRGRKFL